MGLFSPNPGAQTDLVASQAAKILLTGPRAVGKTFGALLAWIDHEKKFGAKAKGLSFGSWNAGLSYASHNMFPKYDAVWDHGAHLWRFPSGAEFRIIEITDTTSHAELRSRLEPASFVIVDTLWPSKIFADFADEFCRPPEGVAPKILICASDERVTLRALSEMRNRFGFTHIHAEQKS